MDGDLEDQVAAGFDELCALAEPLDDLSKRARFLTTACLVGTYARPVHLSIIKGRLVDVTPGPQLMRSWSFAYRAEPSAWLAYWQAVPPPRQHDLLALSKSGSASLEGNLHPFLANLQFFKDLLALPRGRSERNTP